jgi:hypothetical protein
MFFTVHPINSGFEMIFLQIHLSYYLQEFYSQVDIFVYIKLLNGSYQGYCPVKFGKNVFEGQYIE